MIKIELTNDELQALVGLVDSGVKTLGLAAVKSAAALLVKLEAAVVKANEQKEDE
jgi:hypothetical protein